MRQIYDNKFYILFAASSVRRGSYLYDTATGKLDNETVQTGSSTYKINVMREGRCPGVVQIPVTLYYTSYTLLMYDSDENYLGYKEVSDRTVFLPDNVAILAANITLTTDNDLTSNLEVFHYGFLAHPHYTTLSKKYEKESDQMFFRASLDGKVTLYNEDYDLVSNANLEDKMFFNLYYNDKLYVANTFSKTDCKIDYSNKYVEPNLTAYDQYTEILNNYENTYDLIKLAPSLSQLILTKRMLLQIYVQGDDTVSNFIGGTSWESETTDSIDSATELENTYYFKRNKLFQEIVLEDFSINALNTTFKTISDNPEWQGENSNTTYTTKIVFVKEYSKGDSATDNLVNGNYYILTTAEKALKEEVFGLTNGTFDHFAVDVYRICIQIIGGEATTNVYMSNNLFADLTGEFVLAQNGDYQMYSTKAALYNYDYTPNYFNLGEQIIDYSVWARTLVNTDTIMDGDTEIETYDIPSDDFAITRGNYKKCIGIVGLNILQTDYTIDDATKYGVNDYNKYFTSNFIPASSGLGRPYPIAKSTWGNTSLWFVYPDHYLELETARRQEYKLKDCWHLADVIKRLLSKVDPNLIHNYSYNYSQYLYTKNEALGNCQIYIAPKSNVLKGDYDQAAQKAEITFKQLMDMLRDCYRCYWFIDESGLFRIEHISFFLNGMSYNEAGIGTDLTTKIDKFTKKNVLFNQKAVSYDKDTLYSRYEYEWMDDCTDLFGNFAIDVKSNYIQSDSTNSVTIEEFSSDIDYMLGYPDNFSSDGFALLMADSNKRVPIITVGAMRDDEYRYTYTAYIQNYYASWLNLCKLYMHDMPAVTLDYEIAPKNSLQVSGIQRCMEQDIEYQYPQDPAIYKLIKTDIGNGYIESISTNIDTHLMQITLRYEPS